MTALTESFLSMSIHNVFSWPISTFLRFSRIGKPVLDSIIKLHCHQRSFVILGTFHESLHHEANPCPTGQTPHMVVLPDLELGPLAQ